MDQTSCDNESNKSTTITNNQNNQNRFRLGGTSDRNIKHTKGPLQYKKRTQHKQEVQDLLIRGLENKTGILMPPQSVVTHLKNL